MGGMGGMPPLPMGMPPPMMGQPQQSGQAAIWETAIDPASGSTYFYCRATGMRTWEPPPGQQGGPGGMGGPGGGMGMGNPGGMAPGNPAGALGGGGAVGIGDTENSISTISLLIPAEFAGRVIGKGGSGLRETIAGCNAPVDIQVAKENEADSHMQPMRMVTIKGPGMEAYKAHFLLMSRLQQACGHTNWSFVCTPLD